LSPIVSAAIRRNGCRTANNSADAFAPAPWSSEAGGLPEKADTRFSVRQIDHTKKGRQTKTPMLSHRRLVASETGKKRTENMRGDWL
jgi:hypothetical protein